VYKGSPYFPPNSDTFDPLQSFNDEDIDRLKSWGWNSVRLGLMWAGAEPSRGQYNATYFEALRNITDRLGAKGIYTYLELHQDVLSEHFCGDGIPAWTVDDALNGTGAFAFPQPLTLHGYKFDAHGIPSEADCNYSNWANYYSTSAVGMAFQSLYDNHNGVRDRLVALFQEVARRWKDSSYLIGYELMNEPWAGDHFSNPMLMLPGVADRTNLAPFYEVLHTAIREVDVEALVMFEPIPWDNFQQAGFSQVPGGNAYLNKSVLAYHYYRPPDMESASAYFGYRMADVVRLNTSGFLTEFATTWPVKDNTAPSHSLEDVEATITTAENHTQSWSGWQYKVFHGVPGGPQGRYPRTPGDFSMYLPSGQIDRDLVEVLSRPYAQAVAGTILHNLYDATHREYVLRYKARARCALPTEVFVNAAQHFPAGFNVTVSPVSHGVVQRGTDGVVRVHHTEQVRDEDEVTVAIRGL